MISQEGVVGGMPEYPDKTPDAQPCGQVSGTEGDPELVTAVVVTGECFHYWAPL